jgi:hypothetical protein
MQRHMPRTVVGARWISPTKTRPGSRPVLGGFQEKFDQWAGEVEKGGGKLVITHEEPIVADGATMGFMIGYRVDDARLDPYASRGRARR